MDGSLRNFSNVIQDIRDLESECEPETKDHERLHKIADESTRLVNDLLSSLNKYQDIEARPLTITQRFKKPLKRLTWDQSEIPESRRRMLFYLELLISLRQQLARYLPYIPSEEFSANIVIVKGPAESNMKFFISVNGPINRSEMTSSIGLVPLTMA